MTYVHKQFSVIDACKKGALHCVLHIIIDWILPSNRNLFTRSGIKKQEMVRTQKK